jgi:hypothetical protein
MNLPAQDDRPLANKVAIVTGASRGKWLVLGSLPLTS